MHIPKECVYSAFESKDFTICLMFCNYFVYYVNFRFAGFQPSYWINWAFPLDSIRDDLLIRVMTIWNKWSEWFHLRKSRINIAFEMDMNDSRNLFILVKRPESLWKKGLDGNKDLDVIFAGYNSISHKMWVVVVDRILLLY